MLAACGPLAQTGLGARIALHPLVVAPAPVSAVPYTANPGRDVQVQGGSETIRCQTQDRGTEPALDEMTAKAIELLETDRDGFTLQVEGCPDRQARPRGRRLPPDR